MHGKTLVPCKVHRGHKGSKVSKDHRVSQVMTELLEPQDHKGSKVSRVSKGLRGSKVSKDLLELRIIPTSQTSLQSHRP